MRLGSLILLVLLSCACGEDGPGPASVTPLPAPGGAGSRFAFIGPAEDDRLSILWLEQDGGAPPRLLSSSHDGRSWIEPRLIAEDDELFVNWADFPSFIRLGDGSVAVHWLLREGKSSFAYGIRLNVLLPGWEQRFDPLRPHRDGTDAEHGFVSMFPEGDSALGMVWLDGRKMQGPDGTTQLRYCSWSEKGLGEEVVLDPDVCSCCQTTAVLVGGEPLVFYRDRAPGEIRDISVVARRDGAWAAPRALSGDGWNIAACPVNGPAADAAGQRVALAWYTRADDDPRVLLGLSRDGGRSFDPPLRLDGGDPLGRVDVKIVADGTAVVSWLEQASTGVEIRIRPVDPAGNPGSPVTVSATRALRDSGFPRMGLAGGKLFLTWTDAGSPSRLRLVRIDL